MGNLQGGEILLLLVLAVVILGPARLPEYAATLARAVRGLRDLAEGARTQIRQEMGPAFDDVNWSQLDPRQYDPRRIVREALSTPSRTTAEAAGMVPVDGAGPQGGAAPTKGRARPARSRPARPVRSRHDPSLPTPFDVDAT